MKTFSKLREEISEACWKGYKQVGGKKKGVAQVSTAHDCKHCNGKGYHTVTKKNGTKVATNCPQCKGKGYIVTKGVAEGHAAHAYTPKVGDKIRTRMGGQIPGKVTKVTDKHVYFTHPEGKTYKTHISNVRLDKEVNQIDEADLKSKPVMRDGKEIGKTGFDPKASPGLGGKWYAKHHKSGRYTVGFSSRKEAEAEVHAAHGIDEEVEQIDERGANKYKRPTEKGAGLTRAGVMKYRRENPGSKLSTAVTTEPSKLKHGSKAWNRRKSFCARMSGVKGPMKDSKGRPTRKAMSLRRWHC